MARKTRAVGREEKFRRLALDFRAIEMTDDQFLRFCSNNGDLQFELTANLELIVMPPTGLENSWRNAMLTRLLVEWAAWDGTGLAFDSSGGFRLPDGAIRAPDVSWLLRSRWETLTQQDRERFAPICPDFVIELRSRTDPLREVQDKMVEYMENGARLGWLIDPQNRRVYVYTPGQPEVCLEAPETVSGAPVLPGFEWRVTSDWW